MASVIRKIRKTICRNQKGHHYGTWWEEWSQHPRAIRNRPRALRMRREMGRREGMSAGLEVLP